MLVHGRGLKPGLEQLSELWHAALGHGLMRDHTATLGGVQTRFVYYGDLTATIHPDSAGYDPTLDLADRKTTLELLTAIKTSKKFRRINYEAVPGQSSLKEFIADIAAPISGVLGMGERRIRAVLPELVAYWEDRNDYAVNARSRFLDAVRTPWLRGDDIMVVCHCLGSVIAYDAFMELTREGSDKRIDNWLTLGSPLADNYIRKQLAGADANGYPDVLVNWFNVAAEDDHLCHDETVANDFSHMLSDRLISRIKDYRIYNLSERFGQSDPHASIGYLIHPRTSRLINDWLTSAPDDI